MERDLAPLATGELRYGVFDAAVILLREGLEALLVIAALLAFLTKTGHVEQRRWIWAGGGAGILASVAIALVANVVFARAAAGTNRELLEGITGLFAAGMLIYVSFWLHSKAKLGAWQEYIRAKSTAALARNSLLSLALIAFLAVFREGAETVLFYVGIASSIALGDLLAGLAIGAAGLAAIGVLMLAFGVRVPIRPFFLGTSLLLYYLAFKFVGTGLHALQVAGLLPATAKPFLPNWDLVGLYPTVETTLVQVAILVLGCAVLALAGRRPAARPAAAQPA
jgi:high-affinity iron transporter